MKVKFKKLNPEAVIPSYAKPGDAGLDITATDNGKVIAVEPEDAHCYVEYGTGLSLEIPVGHVGLIFPRSSVSKTALALANSVGVIDSGYRGEVKFRFKLEYFANQSGIKSIGKYKAGDKIGQLIIVPYPNIELEEVTELSETERGEGGFGSTDIKQGENV